MKADLNQLKEIVKEKTQLHNEVFISDTLVNAARESKQAKAVFPHRVTLDDVAKAVADHIDGSYEVNELRRVVVFRKRDACR